MGDPIARVQNPFPENIVTFVRNLPKTDMSNDNFKLYMKSCKWGYDAFFKTYYQLCCQVGLYYIDDEDVYHPRFRKDISESEATEYLKKWFSRYYVPNPYTRGFSQLKNPVLVEQSMYDFLRTSDDNSLDSVCKGVFKEAIGNPDIFVNSVNRYSSKIKIENNHCFLKTGGEKMDVQNSRDDKKAFFESFDGNEYLNSYEQKIYYGVPGSGKSHQIDELMEEKGIPVSQKRRVVFHPDYSNADFVGQILPTMEGDKISYDFMEGPFTSILKSACDPKNAGIPFYLIIEEINRGNAAAIFGDIFQLLDRAEDGWSKFEISNKEVWKKIHNLKEDPEGTYCIKLPPNLSILATMNTSDQNVFTLDNAFQRRWNMVHVKNKFDEDDAASKKQCDSTIEGTLLSWGMFLFGGSDGNEKGINGIISKSSNNNGMSSLEDKRLGCWFAKNKNGYITKDDFSNKVLKYLWDDAFHLDKSVFAEGITSFDELVGCFDAKKQLFKDLEIPYASKIEKTE